MISSRIRKFSVDQEAATTAEYAIMLALILFAVISAVAAVGNSTVGLWNRDATMISNAMNGGS